MERFVEFRSGDLLLEGKLHLPNDADRVPMAVVLHPHPRYGGSMDNYVVIRLCEALTDAGFGALRFNFRGVDRSEGTYGRSLDEEIDVHAAITFVTEIVEALPGPVGLVGYSFGAKVALSAGQRDARVGAIAAISPAEFVLDDRIYVPGSRVPKLILVGGADHLCSVACAARIPERMDGPVNLEVYPSADHFWADEDRALSLATAEFLTRELHVGAVPV